MFIVQLKASSLLGTFCLLARSSSPPAVDWTYLLESWGSCLVVCLQRRSRPCLSSGLGLAGLGGRRVGLAAGRAAAVGADAAHLARADNPAARSRAGTVAVEHYVAGFAAAARLFHVQLACGLVAHWANVELCVWRNEREGGAWG